MENAGWRLQNVDFRLPRTTGEFYFAVLILHFTFCILHFALDHDATLGSRSPRGYSGSGSSLVSGANGSTKRPSRNTEHIVTPA
jgi:hypothetical protein